MDSESDQLVDPRLLAQATEFATALTETVRAVVPHSDEFIPTIVGESLSVRQSPGEGIVLAVIGKPLLRLKASYRCCMDRYDDYLAIKESKFEVLPLAGREPIFRYEYVRDYEKAPVAHAHVHAHRDAFTYLMANTGTTTPRAKRRANADEVPQMQDLHFPLGGHRFRPCLEDILETLIDEFGVDHEPETMEALANGRELWRRTQTKSVVRDDPVSAVNVLRKLGYDIEWKSEGAEPPVRHERLRRL